MAKKKPQPSQAGMMDAHQKEFLKLLTSYEFASQGSRQAFRDCVEMGAISIANRWDFRQEREDRYLGMVKHYTREQLETLAKMFGYVSLSIAERWHDCLGELYGDQELNIIEAGQFFTPYHVAQLMAKLTLGNVADVIREKGFATLCEPAVGAGSLALAAAEEVVAQGFEIERTLCVTAIDINVTAVHMAYVQLAVRGVPAVVIRGDALLQQEYPKEECWYTPAYVAGRWWEKLHPPEPEGEPELEAVAP